MPNARTAGLTIRELADRTGLTTHTLRYYERIGLMAPVARAPSGHRRYGHDDLRWVELITRLRASNMPIRRMLGFARLVRRGDSTLAARRAVLDAHRIEIEGKVADMQATLAVLRTKIARYDRTLAARPRRSSRQAAGADRIEGRD